LAKLLLESKEYEKSISLLGKAHDLDPCDLEIVETLGLAYFKQKQLDRALIKFEQVLDFQPNNY